VLVAVELVVLEVTTLVLLVLVAEVLDVVIVVVVVLPPPPLVGGFSGSRWKIAESVPVLTGLPTANPSSGPLTNTEYCSVPVGLVAIGGASGVFVQDVPSQCAKMTFAVGPDPSSPTAQPSPFPAPTP